MRGLFKVWQRRLQAERILGVEKQESHGRSEQDDVRLGVFAELLVFQIFLPEGDHVVRKPVILDALDVLARQANVVVRQIGVIGRQLAGVSADGRCGLRNLKVQACLPCRQSVCSRVLQMGDGSESSCLRAQESCVQERDRIL